MTSLKSLVFTGGVAAAEILARATPDYSKLDDCPGYSASNIQTTGNGLTADLKLAGPACNTYGDDLDDLVLSVTYEDDNRIHVKIQDKGNQVYQVPESVVPRPGGSSAADTHNLKFQYTEQPFSFSIVRADTEEVLFDTSSVPLVFESQYLRLRTSLPDDPFLYGLGEHTDPFRLNTTDYIRTLWNRDAYSIPSGTNIYGSHPFYVEQRATGSHGVFLLNSNGMDIMINNTAEAGQYLEYNTLGGVLDFYFLAGPDPVAVAKQYADVVGAPALTPYWGLGFHQCRYGYQDVFDVAEVVYNYSKAGIPLETMWTDIDYMDGRATFTLDKERFPLSQVQQVVDYLHERDQHYIMMANPTAAYREGSATIERGLENDIYLKHANGSELLGVVWPGVTVFPDWFSENVTRYWNNEIGLFFNKETGVDIDGLWIDMNEPANFCKGLCEDPWGDAVNYPPPPPKLRENPRELPGWPCEFQPAGTDCELGTSGLDRRQILQSRSTIAEGMRDGLLRGRQSSGEHMGLPGRDLLYPKYAIHNRAPQEVSWNADKGGLSFSTVKTDILHENGLAMYDTHNLYGAMMGKASRDAMIARRPGLRPFIITRSSFPGDGRNVGHWLGDNVSNWDQYRFSIHTTMSFSAIYQFSMAGSDVCGFAQDTNEQLCARWASLGAFFTFYRNHNDLNWIPQEFYRWESVAESARKAIDIRYRLLDYIYTAMYKASIDGTPVLNPMFYLYPEDKSTWDLQHQFFYGNGLLVAPVTEENATSVDAYLPKAIFYDWYTHKPIRGKGAPHTFKDQGVTDIPLLIRGGVIMPVRVESGNTTTEVRTQDFELLVALDTDGTASGELYLDDGVSLEQAGITYIQFRYEDNTLTIDGEFGYDSSVKIVKVKLLGSPCKTKDSKKGEFSKTIDVDLSLNEAGSVILS
ncbi:related to alpha-glucosidase b [Cephalotrichum gorgonifer]|uniref:Probable alpha/beta-glucosidase agdC n=1 Tax=Cephalotrichum gorgonifer TaxID=2041049 RepID=A0AAE8MZJ5_9PEZI|nr:related to alpha-glucosidase b [Cephalotrichum gorgonifer]